MEDSLECFFGSCMHVLFCELLQRMRKNFRTVFVCLRDGGYKIKKAIYLIYLFQSYLEQLLISYNTKRIQTAIKNYCNYVNFPGNQGCVFCRFLFNETFLDFLISLSSFAKQNSESLDQVSALIQVQDDGPIPLSQFFFFLSICKSVGQYHI